MLAWECCVRFKVTGWLCLLAAPQAMNMAIEIQISHQHALNPVEEKAALLKDDFQVPCTARTLCTTHPTDPEGNRVH